MLTYAKKGKVAHIILDDGKANAVSHALIDTLNDALDQAEQEASATLLQGREGKFSAGFDLQEIAKGPDAASALVNKGGLLLLRLFSFPQPVIAACTGHAVAAGAFLLLASDTRIGIEGPFRIGLNETAIGMTLPEFGHQLAITRLQPTALTASFVQAQLFNPQQAREVGFLDQVVSADQLAATALAVADELAELPTAVYAANKRDIRRDAIAAMQASFQ
ncbi:MAG: crotonase/enoyl-CoA hydratase family protein [Pseudomonadota bacterium]